jgi:hypothetical protein
MRLNNPSISPSTQFLHNLASYLSEGLSLISRSPTFKALSQLTGLDGREIRDAIKHVPVEPAQAGNFEVQFYRPDRFTGWAFLFLVTYCCDQE